MFPRPDEEHSAVGDAIRAVKPVDGTLTFAGECRRDAPVTWEMTAARLTAAARDTEMPGRPDHFLSVCRFQNRRRLKSAGNIGLLQAIAKLASFVQYRKPALIINRLSLLPGWF